jgi:hypothetical protein
MESQVSAGGVAPATGAQVLGLVGAQLDVRRYATDPQQRPVGADRTFRSNEEFWSALLNRPLKVTMVVQLADFWLSEWFPLRPGLFHTEQARSSREYAERHLLSGPGAEPEAMRRLETALGREVLADVRRHLAEDVTSTMDAVYVYDPYGKAQMLDGGVGCVRLKSISASDGTLYFMGVSSTPVAHEGVPVALPEAILERCMEQISRKGCVRCTLTGRLHDVPKGYEPLFGLNIPQLYVLAEELIVVADAEPEQPFLATGAVIAETSSRASQPTHTWDLADGMFAAFVSFEPGRPRAIEEAASWLDEVYVRGVVGGRVVTDFDERVRRFQDAVFSLDRVMRRRVPLEDAEQVLVRCAPTEQMLERLHAELNDVSSRVGFIQIRYRSRPSGAGRTSQGSRSPAVSRPLRSSSRWRCSLRTSSTSDSPVTSWA